MMKYGSPPPALNRVGAENVDVTLEPADEIGAFGDLKIFVVPLVEFGHAGAGAAGKNKDGAPERMADLAFLEFAILHRRQEVAQPAERRFSQGSVEFIPEYQRELAAQADVAHLVQGGQ